MNIGVANMSYLPQNNRIKDVYEKYISLFKKNNVVILLPQYNQNLEKYLEELQTISQKIDVFFGYDRNFMKIRKSLNKNLPVILPLFADMTRGGMTLWLNKDKFFSNDILLFTSNSDYKLYKRLYKNNNLISDVLSLPIDPIFEQYSNNTFDKKENVFTLLYVGRFFYQKNIHGIIEICYKLKCIMNFKLLLVGNWYYYEDGEKYKAFINNLIEKYELTDYIEFKGYLKGEDLKRVYNEADLFINLTLNTDENFGLVQAEALSQGLPIVCSDWGGLKDHVKHGWNGFKINTRYENNSIIIDLEEALRYVLLLTDNKEREKMAKNSRQKFLASYSSNFLIFKLEAYMEEAIKKNNEPISIIASYEAENYCMHRIYNTITNKTDLNQLFLEEYASSLKKEM